MYQELQTAQQFILSGELRELLVSGGVNLVAAILILIAGWTAASWLPNWTQRAWCCCCAGQSASATTSTSAAPGGRTVNYSHEPTRRINFAVGIDYSDDIAAAQEIVMRVMAADSRGLRDPAPLAPVGAPGASSVDIIVRCWVCNSDYWDVLSTYKRL